MIGVAPNLSTPLGNQLHGVRLNGNLNQVIGNTIAYNQGAGIEFKDIQKFAKENSQLFSPQAKQTLAIYEKYAKAAQGKGQTGIPIGEFAKMQTEMSRAVSELDQVRKERGVSHHDIVGIVDDDDQSRNRIRGHVVGKVIVGQADHVVLRQQSRSPVDLGLQRTQESPATMFVEVVDRTDDVIDPGEVAE